MGNRYYADRYPKGMRFCMFWWGTSNSRFLKIRLHRAERRAGKREIRGLHIRKGLSGARSEVSYRGW